MSAVNKTNRSNNGTQEHKTAKENDDLFQPEVLIKRKLSFDRHRVNNSVKFMNRLEKAEIFT